MPDNKKELQQELIQRITVAYASPAAAADPKETQKTLRRLHQAVIEEGPALLNGRELLVFKSRHVDADKPPYDVLAAELGLAEEKVKAIDAKAIALIANAFLDGSENFNGVGHRFYEILLSLDASQLRGVTEALKAREDVEGQVVQALVRNAIGQ